MKNQASVQAVEVIRYRDGRPLPVAADETAEEEPLEIRVEGQSIAVVMRTPGHDRELAAGFALTEGIVRNAAAIFEITSCLTTSPDAAGNAVDIALRDPTSFDAATLSRHVFSSSSCGVCGKATIEAALQQFPPINTATAVAPQVLFSLPARLAAAQETFQRTGGLHACALFDAKGELLLVREDVGRHNALDKLIGHALLDRVLPLGDTVLLVSGRLSFELVQKAAIAGIPVLCAVSAPSSLAVEAAERFGQTVVGFVRDERFNVYTHRERIDLAA